jgi:hypothetical protein
MIGNWELARHHQSHRPMRHAIATDSAAPISAVEGRTS